MIQTRYLKEIFFLPDACSGTFGSCIASLQTFVLFSFVLFVPLLNAQLTVRNNCLLTQTVRVLKYEGFKSQKLLTVHTHLQKAET